MWRVEIIFIIFLKIKKKKEKILEFGELMKNSLKDPFMEQKGFWKKM